MTQKKVSPAVTTVAGNLPPSYEEANAGCPGYCYNDGAFLWDDKNIRRVFMQKVYSILMLQLFVTLSIVSLFTFYEPVRFYIQTHPGLYSTTSLLFLVTYLMLACCGDLRRQFPWNLILLSVFTLCMAFMLGFVSSYYNTRSVIVCLGITAVVCVCVTVFSFHTKVDITSFQGLLLNLCLLLLVCTLVLGLVVPFGFVPWLHTLYGILGAVTFTMFLAFDTQLLMGNRQYAVSPEEYVFAALTLYLDIVYIFTHILQLFGDSNE
ncbi:fas apoptotic inhibitory molecule 2b [Ictalurus furcatus]|uniref:fas apoptotic inhibitory molecule 2b n=1 Tax=Ictalurus furcatus TaxID=66913 RepID=UPI00234FE339|nr:fas apoptotic inhibitory molecule 2b [Ictalurus furcatus]